jgi:predicted RNase H-like HicB family nuclease
MKLLIIVEETNTGFSAHSPDLLGCVATGRTRLEVERAMKEAIDLHLDALKDEGQSIPTPRTYATYVEVAA